MQRWFCDQGKDYTVALPHLIPQKLGVHLRADTTDLVTSHPDTRA